MMTENATRNWLDADGLSSSLIVPDAVIVKKK